MDQHGKRDETRKIDVSGRMTAEEERREKKEGKKYTPSMKYSVWLATIEKQNQHTKLSLTIVYGRCVHAWRPSTVFIPFFIPRAILHNLITSSLYVPSLAIVASALIPRFLRTVRECTASKSRAKSNQGPGWMPTKSVSSRSRRGVNPS